MNIFSRKLTSTDTTPLPIDPIDLYQSCQYAEGYAYLRGIQEEVLSTWHSKRNERDVICKMNTGSGKTLTGFLMLYSKMIEKKEPVMFVCPDHQLVDQAIDQAKLYGIPVCEFTSSHLPVDFLNAKKVLICTFAKLFNGKSVFNKEQTKIGAIVLDDAHKCVDIAREQTSLRLSREHTISKSLFNLFQEALKYQLPGSYQRLVDGDPTQYQKIPYWAWMDNQEKIIEVINNYILSVDSQNLDGDNGIIFKWNFMSDNLLTYDCYVSGDSIEINPYHAPYHEIPSFDNAGHRYILSATFEDDYDLLKDLGIAYQSILTPIVPKDRKDIGRRLILAPNRFDPDLSDSTLRAFIARYSKDGYNTVVLAPSREKTRDWINAGAEYVDKDNIDDALEKLSSSDGNFMVFNNRYDGIDLNGNYCRILVLDSLPIAGSIQDLYNETRLDLVRAGQRAQKIEQGLGRAVRSGSDYCVVYVMGSDLVNFLGLEKNLMHFTPVTRLQLNLGLKLLDDQERSNSLEVIKETASYCLTQDNNWLRYHSRELASLDVDVSESGKIHLLDLAEVERKALISFKRRLYKEAAELVLSEIIGKMTLSKKERGWYYQFAAQLAYQEDKLLSNDLQSKACDQTLGMFHPQHGHVFKKILKKASSQASLVVNNLKRFDRPQDIIMNINSIIERLQYIPEIKAKVFEGALEELGTFLGFSAQQPERDLGVGPDVLWCMADGHYLILEAKSRVTHDEISKHNVQQLLHSVQWFKNQYGEALDYTGVTLQHSKRKSSNVSINENLRVLDKDALNELY